MDISEIEATLAATGWSSWFGELIKTKKIMREMMVTTRTRIPQNKPVFACLDRGEQLYDFEIRKLYIKFAVPAINTVKVVLSSSLV